ncbi:MAG TPA: HD domain-containing protein [Longimicrobiaceae bacterium]|jgi:HD superfamily phosphohydrolase|nr:HD domain-containing protein [Longimicrobiaceae bacterium]
MQRTEPHPQREFEVVRDPLWNTIRLDPTALRIIDTRQFQRLRHIRQLGLAYLVYPGATHTRFDHALGVYHLARWAMGLLGERGELEGVDPAECRLVPYAALLHDIGHYPFSHALEELDAERVPGHHEELTARFLAAPAIRAALEEVAPNAPERIEALIRARSGSPLQGLVSGSLDLDKIEYLRRDALFCGVPYGEVDVDRLLHAMTLLRDPETGRMEVGIHEKGLSAVESLLFSKYQMFRNVYWHHAVRAATSLYKRLVQESVDAGVVSPGELVGQSDERLLALLEVRAGAMEGEGARRVAQLWLPAVRDRRLPKRALELPGEALRGLPAEEWLYAEGGLVHALELRLAAEMGLPPGGVFVDYPEKPRMMGLDLLLLRRTGRVQRLTAAGSAGLIDLPRVADELYYTARAFRVFGVERRELSAAPMLDLLSLPAAGLRARLTDPAPLLS